jgi:phospholipid/cholesterol/gamma-HCH transport system substrate-binding protein
MARNSEEIKVGVMVVAAAALFLTAAVFVGGYNVLRKKTVAYTTYVKFAGGLQPGTFVRFGGLKVGTVHSAKIDPQDSTLIRIRFEVKAGTPLRTNSRARISSLGFLGENYLEVSAGTRDAALLPPDSEVPAQEIVQLADVFNNVNNITVNANKLVNDLDDRLLVVTDNFNQLIGNLNAVVGPENRGHVNTSLANLDAMLAESRPRLTRTLASLESASAKLGPTMGKANQTIDRAGTLATNLNSVVEENRKEIRDGLLDLGRSLLEARQLIMNLNDTLESNRANLDESLENIRVSSQNLKQFTDTIKQRPFSLIRIKAGKDRVPGGGK